MQLKAFIRTVTPQVVILISWLTLSIATTSAIVCAQSQAGAIGGSRADDKKSIDPKVEELIAAVRDGDGGRVDQLLKGGVKVDAEGHKGETAMDEAVTRSDRPMVKRLLKAGADINHHNQQGNTPLITAALYGEKAIIAFLIEQGAEVNARAKDGKTALMAAVMQGKVETIKALLEKGAKVNDEDNDRYTALTYALRAGNREAVEVLKQAGATSPPPPMKPTESAAPSAVDRKPKLLNVPKPRYTEQARHNRVEGVVIARVLVGADGLPKQVRIVRGLPDGLDEEALRAAFTLRFEPAIKAGKPVAFWVPVEIEFNLK